MNVTLNTQIFAHELRLLNQIVATKPALPILSNVLVRADMEGLSLATTDIEVAFRTSCRADINEPGAVTLPVKRLLDIVEQLPDSDLQIVTDRAHVHLRSGAFRGRLQTLLPHDFPVIPTMAGEPSQLPTAQFQTMIHHVRYAISDKGKYTVDGALMTLTEKAAVLVATDGKRLAVSAAAHSGSPVSVVIPTKALDAVLGMFSEPHLLVSVTENHLFFQAGHRLLASRLLNAKFPAYERIIPRDHPARAVVNRAELAAALRRVGIVSEENQACYFSFAGDAIELASSSAEVGDASEHVAAVFTGEPLKVCCSWQFVLDFLEAAAGQTVTLSVKDDKSPMLLEDGANFINVVMLMRM